MTPLEALYSSNSKLLPTYNEGSAPAIEVDAVLHDHRQIQTQLHDNLQQTLARMHKYADSHRLEKVFEVGDGVQAELHHYRQQSVATRLNFKLSKHYYWHFQVLQWIGVVAYCLQLPDMSQIHLVLNVSLLKKYVGPIPPVVVVSVESVEAVTPTPHAIITERMLDHSERSHNQVLVKWQGSSHDKATWEDQDSLVEMFSADAVEDKVIFQWGLMLQLVTKGYKKAGSGEP